MPSVLKFVWEMEVTEQVTRVNHQLSAMTFNQSSSLLCRILLIQNAPEKIPTNQPHSPLALQHSTNSTLRRNNSSALVIPATLSHMQTMEPNDCQSQQPQQRQQSQIIANIENNSINFELDDDGYSQFSFKHHLRHEEGNSSRGSLHAVDNMSISTTNTSATARNFAGDNESSYFKMVPGLEEVQEAELGEKRVKAQSETTRTSMFNENSDILNDQNYPKLYSSAYLPTTAKTSRSIDEGLKNKQKEKRRYSDTKLLNSLHFENEFLVKKNSHESALGSPIKKEFDDMIFDQLEKNIQNILEMDMNAQRSDKYTAESSQPNQSPNRTTDSETVSDKRNIFKSLPNLDIS